ncbi:MAG: YbfB/YjiJ family MFS transporter [Trichloromonadaceae bacterium]
MATSRTPFHYGWIIVLCGALTLFACLGLARFAYGMLLPAMRASLDFGYDRMGFISTGNFVGYLAAVALAPGVIRRWGPRWTAVGGLLLVAGSLLGISRSSNFVPLLLLYGLTGLGGGFANIPIMVLVSHWFRRERRGRAAGLMILGSGAAIVLSGLLIPVLNQRLGPEGWRTGWLLIGLVALGITILAAALLRNDPAELGLEPLGSRVPLPAQALEAHPPIGGGSILARLGLVYFLFGLTYMVFGTFIVATMVAELGYAEVKAGQFWAWIGLFSMASAVGFGILSDRIGRKGGLMVAFALQSAAFFCAGAQLGSWGLLLAVVLFGLSLFAIPSIMAAAVGDYLGLAQAASGFSFITLCFAVGQIFGPGGAGMLAEASGSFSGAYLASGVLAALAVLLASRLPPPRSASST